MKRSRIVLCLALLTAWAGVGRAETVNSVPNPLRTKRAWVGDNANIIDQGSERQINEAIEAFKQQTGGEIAVITVNNTNDEVAKEFAHDLFNLWGVGEKGKDNGLLILLETEHRRVAVETGYGVEAQLPDSKAMRLVRELAVPRFKDGDFGGGLLALINEYIRVLSGKPAAANPPNKATRPANKPKATPYAAARAQAPPYSASAPPQGAPSVVETAPFETGGNQRASGPFDVIFGLMILAMLPIGLGVLVWGAIAIFKQLSTRKCQNCGRIMRRLDENEEDAFLSSDQQFEERLGGLDYKVWRCDNCSVCHIERSARWASSYKECPRCHHYTMQTTSETVQQPTYHSSGLRNTNRRCQYPHCGYFDQTSETLPMLVHTPVVVSSSTWDSSSSGSGSSWGGSSSSGGGDFSSSSSDFGGGSSGGGGGETGW